MANAKQCDICGKYYSLPEPAGLLYKAASGKVELFKNVPKLHHAAEHEGLYFDACDECVQEITDLILEKRATWESKAEE